MKNKRYDSYFYELKIYPPHVCRYYKRLLGAFALLYYGMLYLSDPFGVVGSLPGNRWFNVLLYVAAFVLSFGAVYRLLPVLLRRWLPADGWNHWLQVAMLTVLVLFNALLLCALKCLWWESTGFDPMEYFRTLERTVVVGVVPFVLYLTTLNVLKRYPVSMRTKVPEPPVQAPAPALAPLLKRLRIEGDQLLYIESFANNKLIYYLENGELKQHKVRSTIPILEEKYRGRVDFIRCSRSCVVNKVMIDVQQSHNLKGVLVLRNQNIQLRVSNNCRGVVRKFLKSQL